MGASCSHNTTMTQSKTQPNTIWLQQPAADWNEALPVGNGRLGAMVFGGVTHERVQLNEDTLWSGEPVTPADPEVGRPLAEIRDLVFHRQYAEATEALKQMQGPFTQSYLPLGDLRLDFGHGEDAEDYRRELDLETATAKVSYRVGDVVYTRTIFAGAPDQAIVMRLTASRPGMLDLRVSLSSPLRSVTESRGPETLRLTGRAPAHVEPQYREVEPGIVYEDTENGRGMRFCALVRAALVGGSVTSDGSVLTITQADSVTLSLTAATSFQGFDQAPRRDGKDCAALAAARMDAVAAKTFDAVYDAHLRDYQPLFRRVDLNLGDPESKSGLPTDQRLHALQAGAADPALEALYFQYGRYLLIASSRPGTQPANLQGIWNQEMRPPWSSNFTVNINTQMNYWPAEATNLAELTAPLFDLIDALRVTGQNAAAAYYGASGWCAHHNSDLWARANPVGAGSGSPSWANWPMGGAWLVQHLWEHFEFSGDREFLAARAYPALKSAAEFLLDFLVEAPNGFLVTCPSTSPENEFVYTDHNGSRAVAMVTAGTTMDLAIVREVFTNTVEAARILDVDSEFAARAANALHRLPPFGIGEFGELREWPSDAAERDPGHRHISHLYAAHPGVSITPNKTPELAQAALNSLDRRVAHGGGYTGWSRAWLINQYARLGAGDKAHHSLHVLLTESTYPSLLDAHPPFQIDGNFGGTSGMAEMLLQSHDGAIDLLPALPKAWPRGKVTGMRARGGIEVSLTWAEGRLTEAALTASAATSGRVRHDGRSVTVDCPAGETVHLDGNLQ